MNEDFPDFHHNEDMDYRPHREPSPEEQESNRRTVTVILLLWFAALLMTLSIYC